MQHAVPGLVEEEKAFLEAKMGRPVRILPRPVAFFARLVREVAMSLGLVKRPSHGIFHPYAAQDPMTGRDYEVFTQGYQAMVHGARNPSTRRLDERETAARPRVLRPACAPGALAGRGPGQVRHPFAA
ncbi:MAG: hypothetical protein M3R38_09910 [Actinomycetota bacterium]|nr:hypothetical protein [Actinomycetota bacterium]